MVRKSRALVVPPTKSYAGIPAGTLRMMCFTVEGRGPQVVFIAAGHVDDFKATLKKNHNGRSSEPVVRWLVGKVVKFKNGFQPPLFTWKVVPPNPDADPKLLDGEFLPSGMGLGDLRKASFIPEGDVAPDEEFFSKAYLSSYDDAFEVEHPGVKHDIEVITPRWATDEDQVRGRIVQFHWEISYTVQSKPKN